MVQADLRRIYLRDITIVGMGCTHQPAEVFAGLVDHDQCRAASAR